MARRRHTRVRPRRPAREGPRPDGAGADALCRHRGQSERQDLRKGGTCAGENTVGFDGGKLVKGRKRHIAVDTQGLLLAVWVSPASVGDRDGARELLAFCHGSYPRLSLVWADGGYGGPLAEEVATAYGLTLEIVQKPQCRKGFSVLPRRWGVERTFAWLGKCRRLSKDYEALPASSEAMIRLAMTRLMLRRVAP